MTHNADVLERLTRLSGAPSRGFEDLLRRRAKRELARKVGAIAVVTALIVALLGVGIGTLDDRTKKPANPPEESHAGTFTGMVIRYAGDPSHDRPGDLVAEDPRTGEAITLAAASDFRDNTIARSAASADGRWVAFESAFCDDSPSVSDWERRSGLWVTNGTDEPRQLTAPCAGGSEPSDSWAWSPTGSRLVTVEGDHLILIDPATGDRTDLGQAAGDVTSLAWSPDGTRIAYATVPLGSPNGNSPDGSVYVVSVDGGEHASIAEAIGQVPGGEEGAGIAWSPDSSRIAVLAEPDPDADPRGTLYVMNADGSDRRPLAEGVLVAHTLGSPNVVWSPNGTRIAYATFNRGDAMFSRNHDKVQVWSASADGSTPVLVFSPTSDPPEDTESGGPIWSPDGKQIAFRYDTHSSERSYLIAGADGAGVVHEIDELRYRSWRGGWYFCECYG
jgi:dipeptidyl aminopeptidase/acylaminoacyl peptidase